MIVSCCHGCSEGSSVTTNNSGSVNRYPAQGLQIPDIPASGFPSENPEEHYHLVPDLIS